MWQRWQPRELPARNVFSRDGASDIILIFDSFPYFEVVVLPEVYDFTKVEINQKSNNLIKF
jgi:hypothetical protein